MKKLQVLVIGVLLLLAMTAVSAAGSTEAKAAPRELIVSTWGLSEDSLWSEVYEPFEKQYNVKVILDTGNAQERYTKLKSDPNTKVDVIELSQKNTADGVADGLFSTLQISDVKQYNDLIKGAQDLVKIGSGASYTLNSIGIIYNPKAAGITIDSWDDLWNPALKGKISIPDITTTFGPAFMVMCSDVKGVDFASDKGETAFKALEALKPNVLRTYAKSSDVASLFQNGEIAVAIVGDFGVPVITKADPDAVYVVPASGTYANFNVINIAKNTKNRDLAVAYINYRLDAETELRTAKALNEAPVNAKVKLSPELAENKTVGDVAARAAMVDFTVVNPLMASWVDRFNRLMNK
ncbi:polyamine ABC transporter substrate-binding protein [Sphaerochaeta sp. PS]|uniref:polyamine ABC transporter substrate-binding protein n=1 Tax=Sphaerochaeta sp. PS TaxID=3076336 RepID=UPI0028A4A0E4|nr:polyamine ABC transporter substrate-binding protein [Sphaerochaeta sp. PS]MDT4761600.1 polyamine ABC transporter substrate-binding protein [Sphaerochaeta sp. PS]